MREQIFKTILAGLGPGNLIDLGAGHCKFSQIAHDMGFNVTALDARKDRMPDNTPFVFCQQDVRDAELSDYDIVCILGLFYHMTLPDQKSLLEKCKGKTVIIDTHYALNNPGFCEDYEGELRIELINESTEAFGNNTSFWHTEPSLIRMFSNYGFTIQKVLPEHHPGRSFYILESK